MGFYITPLQPVDAPRRRCPGLPVAIAVACALLALGTLAGYLLARALV